MNFFENCTVVITTFFSGKKLDNCLLNIPDNFSKIVIDNGLEIKNKSYYENKFKNLKYITPKENLGVPRSYSHGLSLVKTRYMFTTQPDVIVKKNCIENLLEAILNYPNAAILSPTIFHNSKYLVNGDYKILKYKNKKFLQQRNLFFNQAHRFPPDGDLSVDAVTGTAMLIDTLKLKNIGDWDKNIFNYYEDMDICLRLRLAGYEIVKIRKAEVDHDPFSSHDISFEEELNFSRNWHYSWSSLYFFKKHNDLFFAYKLATSIFINSLIRLIFYFFINKKKFSIHFSKFLGISSSLLGFGSNYRPFKKK